MAGLASLFVALCCFFSMIPLSAFLPNPTLTLLASQPSLPAHLQNDLTLPQPKCRAEFGLLYPQLEENEAIWRRKGGIKYSDVQNAAENCRHGCVHLLIKHGQVWIRRQEKDWQSRVRSSLQLLERSYSGANAQEKEEMEGVELVISTADFDGFTDPSGSRGAGWVLDKREGEATGQYLFPDFSFSSWPEAGIASYEEFRRAAAKINDLTPWKKKSNKAFWRGDALKGSNIAARNSLLTVATGSGTESWSDVKRTSFWESGPDIGAIVSPQDHCRNKYLIHAEGVAYSGRSKFILGCQSAVVTHKLTWTQHFHPALDSHPSSPDRNIVLLEGEYFESLPATIKSLMSEENKGGKSTGEKIAENAKRTLTDRYLTPAATGCYIRAALLSYSRAMDRGSWPGRRGAEVREGGGVKPGAGTSKGSLKELGVEGDVELGIWGNLGQPEWPPQ